MAMMSITLVGLYNFDETLFDNLTMPQLHVPTPLPNYFFTLSKDVLINTILEKSGDFPCLYPDFDFMKMMIGVWSKNCAYKMQILYDSLNYQYNPIENYDRTSEISRSGVNQGTGNSVDSQTAFNSYQAREVGRSDTTGTNSVQESVTESVHGNIGVRSSQELIQQQRELSEFKWYDIVANDFINRFCVQIF